MKAWAFYRRSTDKQELSVEDQRRACHDFAASRGWHILREFEPMKGWGSGLTIDQDPAFQEMIRLAERGDHGASYLIVYDVSRFGRLETQEKIYWEQRFRKQGGIQIVYVREDFKNDGSLGDTLLRVVKHAEAHEYSRKLSETTLRGAKSHATLGHSTGGAAPYGYDRLEIDPAGNPVRVMKKRGDWKSNKLNRVIWTPSPTEAPVVRWIFEAYEKHTGLATIAHHLNDQRAPAPRGRWWSRIIIHYILRNRAYVGDRIYNRRSYKAYRRGERGSLANPPSSWVIREVAHEPIVPRDLFDRVQLMARKRAVTIGRTFQRPYLLTGIAFCANCGYRLMGYPKSGNGQRYLTYTCSGYHRIGKAVCRSYHLDARYLEGSVVQAVRDQMADPAMKAIVREALEGMINEQFGDGAQSRVCELEAQIAELNRQIENVVAAVKAGAFSPTLNQTLADLEAQRAAVGAELRKAEARTNQEVGAEILAEKVMEYFGQFDRMLEQAKDIEDRKAFLRTFVRQVNVSESSGQRSAEIWLWKIPQKNLGEEDSHPLFPRVNCGGTHLRLGIAQPQELIPLLISRRIELPRSYARAA